MHQPLNNVVVSTTAEQEFGSGEQVIAYAQWDPQVKTYWRVVNYFGMLFMASMILLSGMSLFFYVDTLTVVLITFGTIGVLPLVLNAIYASAYNAYFNTLEIVLTPRTLQIRRGGVCGNCCVYRRVEKTILLDRIQDMSISQGCFQKCFNIMTLTVETAGQAGQNAGPELCLAGIVDPKTFRNLVLNQRHKLVEGGVSADGLGITTMQKTQSESVENPKALQILEDIRDSLQRMENGRGGLVT